MRSWVIYIKVMILPKLSMIKMISWPFKYTSIDKFKKQETTKTNSQFGGLVDDG